MIQLLNVENYKKVKISHTHHHRMFVTHTKESLCSPGKNWWKLKLFLFEKRGLNLKEKESG